MKFSAEGIKCLRAYATLMKENWEMKSFLKTCDPRFQDIIDVMYLGENMETLDDDDIEYFKEYVDTINDSLVKELDRRGMDFKRTLN